MSFKIEFQPNMVRDSFWISSLKQMFEALDEIDEEYAVELAGTSYMLVRLSEDILFAIALPENFDDMSEDEIEDYLKTLSEKMPSRLPTQSDWI